jgi:carbon starvation protein
MPCFHRWSSAEGYLWPALFITVACGAISGFHTLVASGTSSKQIANERHIKRIGYGAMLTEALVAVLAIVATAILFSRHDNYAAAFKNNSPIEIFGKGYGIITQGIFKQHGPFIAITILNAFILTTLDTATRIARYLTEELLGIKNRYASTLLVVVLSAALAFSGKGQRIWMAFGAANQLMAALALFVLSCWLIAKAKNAHLTFWPALFMLVTTVAALVAQAIRYFKNHDFILIAVIVFLIGLAVFMVLEIATFILRRRRHE